MADLTGIVAQKKTSGMVPKVVIIDKLDWDNATIVKTLQTISAVDLPLGRRGWLYTGFKPGNAALTTESVQVEGNFDQFESKVAIRLFDDGEVGRVDYQTLMDNPNGWIVIAKRMDGRYEVAGETSGLRVLPGTAYEPANFDTGNTIVVELGRHPEGGREHYMTSILDAGNTTDTEALITKLLAPAVL